MNNSQLVKQKEILYLAVKHKTLQKKANTSGIWEIFQLHFLVFLILRHYFGFKKIGRVQEGSAPGPSGSAPDR
jgi:hypothetical protein